MNKINFENLPSTNTPVNAENLNLLQTNVDNAKLEKTINVSDPSTKNLNDYTTEGRYYFSSAPTNIPAGVNGFLEVMVANNGAVKQIWYRHGTANTNDHETYVRTLAGSWSNWVKVLMANEAIVWKEPGYGDKFRIMPDFAGAGSSNKLKIQSTTGGAGTDPTNFTDLISISAETGDIINNVTNNGYAKTYRMTWGTAITFPLKIGEIAFVIISTAATMIVWHGGSSETTGYNSRITFNATSSFNPTITGGNNSVTINLPENSTVVAFVG